jgi:hypothetical protein
MYFQGLYSPPSRQSISWPDLHMVPLDLVAIIATWSCTIYFASSSPGIVLLGVFDDPTSLEIAIQPQLIVRNSNVHENMNK